MAEAILLPKQGITVESCVITQWHKRVGERVQKGDALFTYETDKSSFDVEAEADGMLLDVFFPDGEDIPVLTVVGVIGAPGEDVSSLRPEAAAALTEERFAGSGTGAAGVLAPSALEGDRPAEQAGAAGISPRAKAVAAMLGVNPAEAVGSGPDGRVIERDVRALFDNPRLAAAISATALEAPTPAAAVSAAAVGSPMPITAHMLTGTNPAAAAPSGSGYIEERLSGVRRAIARGMTASLQTMAQLTLSSSFDATAILEHRKAFKASKDPEIAGITLTDMVLFAVSRALALPEHRALNAHLLGETMRYFTDVSLACAVDTPRGLLVPTIFGAQRMSLRAISIEAKRLAALCQAGNIPPDLLTGATFTVSNLGGLGIEHFTPVINPPQTGILGVNNITWRPRDAQGSLYPAMGLSITFDHRTVDGAPAARFLSVVGSLLENFTALLAG